MERSTLPSCSFAFGIMPWLPVQKFHYITTCYAGIPQSENRGSETVEMTWMWNCFSMHLYHCDVKMAFLCICFLSLLCLASDHFCWWIYWMAEKIHLKNSPFAICSLLMHNVLSTDHYILLWHLLKDGLSLAKHTPNPQSIFCVHTCYSSLFICFKKH